MLFVSPVFEKFSAINHREHGGNTSQSTRRKFLVL